MSYEPWLNYLRTAEKASIITGKVRKVHYKMCDGAEMLEEYSMETGILIRRAWKKRTDVLCMKPADDDLNTRFDWNIELGELPSQQSTGEFMVKESSATPIVTKRITRKNLEWRIRNLPYPIETYQVTVDANNNAIVVRTTNKKYFKQIVVPELKRCGLVPDQTSISIAHQHNTLIIMYQKPALLEQLERDTLKMLQEIETETDDDVDVLQELYGLARS